LSLFVLGLLQRGFSLTQTVGHIFLASGQIPEAIEYLQVFTLLCLIFILSHALTLVPIFLLTQFQLLQLLFKLL
jgi:hypothetical protein